MEPEDASTGGPIDPSDTSDPRNPRSPLRTVQVLHALAASGQAVSLACLAEQLQLPKTSLFRLLRALEEGGYVASHDGKHQVGPEALRLGAALVRGSSLAKSARPVMEWLAAKCDETVILATFDDSGTQIVYSDVIEPGNPLRFSIRPGLTKPLFSSASGQTLLAFLAPERRAEYLKQVEFVQLASGTITSATVLKRRLNEIRTKGFAVSVDGMFDGVYSVAAPLVDAGGNVKAAISISAPTSRGQQQEESFTRLLKRAGEEISRLLGYTGAYWPR